MPRRGIIWVFVAVTFVPAATVLWLGWRLLDQDRRLETQYRQERREQAADRAVRSLQTALSDPALFRTPPAQGAILVFYPAGPALFHPESAVLSGASGCLPRLYGCEMISRMMMVSPAMLK
jgi:hypothetical protein